MMMTELQAVVAVEDHLVQAVTMAPPSPRYRYPILAEVELPVVLLLTVLQNQKALTHASCAWERRPSHGGGRNHWRVSSRQPWLGSSH